METEKIETVNTDAIPVSPIVEASPVSTIQWYFSLVSGEIQSFMSDEVKNIPNTTIPLKEKPTRNCRKCFNRLHIGKNIKNGLYVICPHCAKKYVDFDKISYKEAT